MSEQARYHYQCSQCGGSVSKPATGTTSGRSKTKVGLHGWRCPKDGAVRVVRKLN